MARMIACAVAAVSALVLSSDRAVAQKPDAFQTALEQHRYSLEVQDGAFSGTAAPVLTTALAQAHFVLVGEDHGTVEIPRFWEAICRATVPAGFRTMAIETGPLAADALQPWIRSPDGAARVAAFEKAHPDSLAFYNLRQEFGMLRACARDAAPAAFQLWGLDQEFIGSAEWILDRILQAHPGPQTRAVVARLRRGAAAMRANAERSGNPADLFLLAARDEDLAQAEEAVRADGGPRAQTLFAALEESHTIYAAFGRGANYESNRRRAELMKQLFAHRADASTGDRDPKVLVKMGADHLYKGRNPLHSSELGDYIAERAEGHGQRSLHVMVFGLTGEQLRYTKVGAPYSPGPLDLATDQSFAFMTPLFDARLRDGWTMYDLRALREHFDSVGHSSEDLERLVFGYDLVVLIPTVTPSSQIR